MAQSIIQKEVPVSQSSVIYFSTSYTQNGSCSCSKCGRTVFLHFSFELKNALNAGSSTRIGKLQKCVPIFAFDTVCARQNSGGEIGKVTFPITTGEDMYLYALTNMPANAVFTATVAYLT